MLIFSASFVAEKINMVKPDLLPPPEFRSLLGDFLAPLGRHALRALLSTHPPHSHGGGLLAVLRGDVLDLAEPNRARALTCPTGNSRMHPMRKLPVAPICRMGSRLLRRANHNDALGYPASMKRDVSADRHDTWGGDAMDADGT